MKNTSKSTKSGRQRFINRTREIQQHITNGQRPEPKQRDTDIIISRQMQTNIRNLKISNQYTKAKITHRTETNMDNQYNITKIDYKAKRTPKTNTSKPTNHQQQPNSPENYKTTHNPGTSRHQPSVVCWTSWPAQPGQDGRELRQPGGAQKKVTHPGEAEDS